MTKFETIRYEKEEKVAKVILDRPEAFNSFTPVMLGEIARALKAAERDAEVRAVALTGEGKAFCAGQDIKSVDEDIDYGNLLRDNYHPMLKTLEGMPKPVVAAVNGVAAGAGWGLALAADYRIVKPESKFVSAFMGIGLVPDCGFMYILPRLVGYAKALEIATIGKPISGEEAQQLGLATEVIEAKEWEAGVTAFA